MQHVSMKLSALQAHPFKRMDSQYWIEVAGTLEDRGKNIDVASNEDVKEAMELVDRHIQQWNDAVAEILQQASALRREAREARAAYPELKKPRYIPRPAA